VEQLAILESWERAKLAIRECKDIDEAKDIRDKAQALKVYAQQARESLEVQNNIAEIKIRAERRIGEFSRELETQQGGETRFGTHHYGENRTKTQVLKDVGIDIAHASRYEAIASIPEEKFESEIIKKKEAKEELTTASILRLAKEPHVSHNSGNNEWYTPKEIIQAVKKVMGSIDLDPASSEVANVTIQAHQFFTIEDNGLIKKWNGNIWLNPPYAQPFVQQFCDLVSEKYDSKEISQACVLVNNATETAFFQRMMKSASAICFPSGRIKFIDVDGNASGAPLQGQAILYFGNNQNEFIKQFSPFGGVVSIWKEE